MRQHVAKLYLGIIGINGMPHNLVGDRLLGKGTLRFFAKPPDEHIPHFAIFFFFNVAIRKHERRAQSRQFAITLLYIDMNNSSLTRQRALLYRMGISSGNRPIQRNGNRASRQEGNSRFLYGQGGTKGVHKV